MVQNLKYFEISRQATLSTSVPPRSILQPLHLIRAPDLQELYLQQQFDYLNLHPVSSRTRRRTAYAPPPAGAEIVNINTPVTAAQSQPRTTLSHLSPTSLPITYTEFNLRGNPANRSKIVLTENISAIDIQHEQHRIDKRE